MRDLNIHGYGRFKHSLNVLTNQIRSKPPVVRRGETPISIFRHRGAP